MNDKQNDKQNLPFNIFLLILSIIFFFIISVVVIIKRHVSIRIARNSKVGYTIIGHGLPKDVRDSVEQEINATRQVNVEPRIFTEEYENNIEDYLTRENITFIYRLKVVDEYKELVPLITLFTDAKNSLSLSKETTELIASCTDFYTNARRSYKPFTESHYKKFSQIKDSLLRIFTSRKNSSNREELIVCQQDYERIGNTNRLSHSVESIDSQTALIEIDNKESQMVEDNSINNLHENLMGCVTARFSKSSSKKQQESSNKC